MNRTLSRLSLLVSLVLVAAVVPAKGQSASHADAEKQVLALERALNDAVAKHDIAPFKANVAADAMQIDAAGGITKVFSPDFETFIKTASIQSWTIDSSRFMWVNDNTVLHLYRWSGKGTYQGQPVPSPTWSSTLWTNKSGKWQAVFHQETVAMPPPAAAPKAAAKAPAGKK
jgi:hypothetical protein